ncbi:hypothetical protein [Lacimicrobium alkaliphilum]|uniref:Uncharacterized protein n=1 Tax=Lacimicrobium alkaliphilum TaxID=1526571 RepID=A0A0U3B9I5_9ALTE|nr:hypothetical protein [Lacimicrobium alkaliphilum]ALS98325.1 hypothetical protein AT746_08715 [Lacimicrobium alkaliphilum]
MKYLILMFVTFISVNALANEKAEALKHIASFADSICGNLSHAGATSKVEFSGEAKAEFNNLLKKLADLGISGSGKYSASDFSGVPHASLAGALSDQRKCKREMAKLLKDDLLTEKIKSCRLRSHGIEYYKSTQEWSSESGYQKGGPSRASYCEAKRSEHAASYPNRVVSLISATTSHKTERNPFKQDYYNHFCSYKDEWDPIYKLKENKNCP